MLVETVRSFVENELYPHEDLVEKLDERTAEVFHITGGQVQALGAGGRHDVGSVPG